MELGNVNWRIRNVLSGGLNWDKKNWNFSTLPICA